MLIESIVGRIFFHYNFLYHLLRVIVIYDYFVLDGF